MWVIKSLVSGFDIGAKQIGSVFETKLMFKIQNYYFLNIHLCQNKYHKN